MTHIHHELERDPKDPRVFVVRSRCDRCAATVEKKAPGALPARLVAERFALEHAHEGEQPT